MIKTGPERSQKKKKIQGFDCFKCQFGKPYSIENSATQPLLYVLGFKNDNSVKDVTARYAKQWLSHTRKNRIDQEWWIGTLLMFDSTPYKDNLIEDDEIKSQLLVQPMPNSIAELKSHPLYVLRRHLLKFESIYPDTAIPLGYIRKEPVYARECVRTLHSRDNWLKEGRLVRLSETPYKMVKSRPKWNKPKENPDALDLALYGEWQTEHYIPPPAVDGKVPRNEYGNVELFKPWMLPQGTVQVRGQGLQRVAKKLNIDIAAAMVGWDNHSGFSHPVMDGWIVCEEYADTLMAAWLEDQEIQKQREIEKKDKRVYDNWRLLIRGLLIKERLKTKFLQATPVVKKLEKQETFSDEEDACDVQFSWPRNRQDRITEEKSKAIQLKTEKDKNVVEKAHDVKVVKEINCVTRKKRGQKKQIEITVSECKRQAPAISSSDSCSSTDEFEDTKFVKLKPDKVFTKMNHQKDDDLDFIPAGRSRKRNMLGKEKNKTKTDVGDEDEDDDQKEDQGSSTDENEDTKFVKLKPNKGLTKMNHQKDDDPDFIPAGRSRKRNMLKKNNKTKTDVGDEEEDVDQKEDQGSSRVTRKSKSRERLLDETNSEACENQVVLTKLLDGVGDGDDADVIDGGSHVMKGRKTRSGASRKGKTIEKVEEAAHDSEEDQTQVRNNNVGNEISIVGVAKSRAQRVRSSHMTKSCGKSSKNGKPGSTNLGEENKERGVRGRLRCSK